MRAMVDKQAQNWYDTNPFPPLSTWREAAVTIALGLRYQDPNYSNDSTTQNSFIPRFPSLRVGRARHEPRWGFCQSLWSSHGCFLHFGHHPRFQTGFPLQGHGRYRMGWRLYVPRAPSILLDNSVNITVRKQTTVRPRSMFLSTQLDIANPI